MALKENNIKTNTITKLNKLDFNSVTEIADPNGEIVTKVKTEKDTSEKPGVASNTKATVSKPSKPPMAKPSVRGMDLLPVTPAGLEEAYTGDTVTNELISKADYRSISKKNITNVDRKFGIFDKNNKECNETDFLRKGRANRNNNKRLLNKTNPECDEEVSILDNAITTISKIDTNSKVAKVSLNANFDKFIKDKLDKHISRDLVGKGKAISSTTDTARKIKDKLIKNTGVSDMGIDLKTKLLNTITGCGPGIFDYLLSLDFDFNLNIFKYLFGSIDCDGPNSTLILAKNLLDNGGNSKAILAGMVSHGVNSKDSTKSILDAKKFSTENAIHTTVNINKEGSILKSISNSQSKSSPTETLAALDTLVPTWDKDKDNNKSYHKVRHNKTLVNNSKQYLATREPTYNSTGVYNTGIGDLEGIVVSSAFA